jgi:hypothetical protein
MPLINSEKNDVTYALVGANWASCKCPIRRQREFATEEMTKFMRRIGERVRLTYDASFQADSQNQVPAWHRARRSIPLMLRSKTEGKLEESWTRAIT